MAPMVMTLRMMWEYTRLLYSCQRNPPTPGVPVSISAATMTSQASPRESR
jgi:hypothetical protein